jgi:alkylhydroperoxidase family enzyme
VSNTIPLGQEERPPCSLPLGDADLSLGNANWTKGLQAMSDWIWSANLNPVAFPNNLGRYFLQIPAIFEQQLNFSATLIFDEPSFRNGIQISGFVDRVQRELVISFIAQLRHCWYSMTHHAILGYLTAKKHGLSDDEYAAKWSKLTEYEHNLNVFSPLERAVLTFARAFATDAKAYTDAQYQELRSLLEIRNREQFVTEGKWMSKLEAARAARALAMARGQSIEQSDKAAAEASALVNDTIPNALNERKIDAQIVELAFLCLQF